MPTSRYSPEQRANMQEVQRAVLPALRSLAARRHPVGAEVKGYVGSGVPHLMWQAEDGTRKSIEATATDDGGMAVFGMAWKIESTENGDGTTTVRETQRYFPGRRIPRSTEQATQVTETLYDQLDPLRESDLPVPVSHTFRRPSGKTN
ncbi:MAG: hypothetical protein KGJ07_09500 [Patescibacteria group bacterium]|nr:hypothetical protein [Patescibacteria group bacterium]